MAEYIERGARRMMNNREHGWPEDCQKCDLYDQEKQDCGMWSVGSRTPVCECMSRKRYDYLKGEW